MAGQLSNPPATPFRNLADIDPGRLALSILVPAHAVNPSLVKQCVTTVTTMREWSRMPGMEASRVDEPMDATDPTAGLMGDKYVYTHHEPAGTLHAFNFVQKRTAEEILTPIAGKSYIKTESMFWHEVLNDLYFEESRLEFDEYIIDNQRKLLARVKPKGDITPGGNFPTKLLVQFFASHQPFEDSFFKLDPQVPGLVTWEVRNSTGSRTCLHPYLEFADSATAGPILPGCGAVHKDHQAGQPSIFPATSHTGAKNHVCFEDVQQVQGVYFCERRTAMVPRGLKKLKGVGV